MIEKFNAILGIVNFVLLVYLIYSKNIIIFIISKKTKKLISR